MSDQPPVFKPSTLDPSTIKPLFSATTVDAARTPPVQAVVESPLSAALHSAFRLLYLVVAVLAVVWLASGIRSVDPGTQAVVYRLGAIERVVTSGLALAWPRPFEEVVFVPGADRQLSLEVTRLDLLERDSSGGTITPVGIGLDPRKDGGFALTGDAGVVHLRGSLAYVVDDARTYVLARERVPSALTRVFLAATIAACAQRGLDGVMVASPDSLNQAQNESVAQSRERLRGDIVTDMNRRLATLGLGVAVSRVDLTAYLPDRAKPSFDAVIAAESSAAKEIAEARTAATKLLQETDAARSAIISAATAKAQETITAARVATNRINSVLAEDSPERRQLLITRLYRERMETIIKNAGGTVTVPDGQSAKLFVPGR